MNPIVWLASYPKSGNTWVRMILTNLDSRDRPADINTPLSGSGMASSREAFDEATLLPSGLLTHDEADQIRPRVHAALARQVGEGADIRFVKVHDAYRRVPGGAPLLAGADGARGALVIVRDPRDIAVSLACHIGGTIDQAIEAMRDDDHAFCSALLSQAPQLRQHLGSWSDHVASWLDQPDVPAHLLRYEDLEARPIDAFGCAMDFVGRNCDDEQIERAIRFADLSELQRQEREKGFTEASSESKVAFFRSGRSGVWKDELSAAQVARIERDHGAMMSRLGYDPAKRSTAAGKARMGSDRECKEAGCRR
jgi:hypothetical protein